VAAAGPGGAGVRPAPVSRPLVLALVCAALAASCGGGGAAPSAEPRVRPGPGPAHFTTLPPGASLPSGAQCASWIRAVAPLPETKRVNLAANQTTGHRLAANPFDADSDDRRANSHVAPRVDGGFTGTTWQVLRWAACKWGIDEDLAYAQGAQESWWRQPSLGDYQPDAAACPPGHGLGVDGRPGQCPQSYGVLQDRYPFLRSSWPGIARSTAMSADTAYAVWRACFEGYERWLGTNDRGQPYAPGDAWGCIGRWVSGRWHTPPAEKYIASVRGLLQRRVWEQPDFRELG
jgi:hypothetical protein